MKQTNTHTRIVKRKKLRKGRVVSVLLLVNLVFGGIFFISQSKDNSEVAVLASGVDVEQVQGVTKENETGSTTNHDGTTIGYKIQSVTHEKNEDIGVTLYFSHATNEGAFFNYVPSTQYENDNYPDSYWFVDNKTLERANVQLLDKDDTIEAVFYDGEYFEIKYVNKL